MPDWAWLQLVEASGDAMVVGRGPDGRILHANRAAQRLYGKTLEEFRQMTGRMLHPPEDGHFVTECDAALEQSGFYRIDRIRLACAGGELRWGAVEVALTRRPDQEGSIWISILRDVTDQVLAEQTRFEHVERLSTIGRLAAGVAHEINNPATFLMTNLHLVRAGLERLPLTAAEQAEWVEMLDDCLMGVQRITRITRELSDYSRVDRVVAGPCSLDDVAAEAVKLVGLEIRRVGRLVFRPGGLPIIIADRGRLQQVVVNLLLNARDAIEPGGTVDVSTRLADGRHQVVVQDDGRGMDDETKARVFAPFFTTKPSGHGTGLGLAVSWRIAQQHGGQILVNSRPGQGATFVLDLPTPQLPITSPKAPPEPLAPTRRARVLLIDDEEAILRATQRMLTPIADIDVASSGPRGLELARSRSYDLVLLDLLMPDMDGAMVWSLLSPDIQSRTRFLTAGPASSAHASLLDRVGWIAKPASPRLIQALISEAVNRQK